MAPNPSDKKQRTPTLFFPSLLIRWDGLQSDLSLLPSRHYCRRRIHQKGPGCSLDGVFLSWLQDAHIKHKNIQETFASASLDLFFFVRFTQTYMIDEVKQYR